MATPELGKTRQDTTTGALEAAVRRALYDDGRLRDFDAPRIHIEVHGDEVHLSGAVCTPETRRIAEARVLSVPEVKAVQNNLRTDADLMGELRDTLAADPRTAVLAKDAVVFRGTAELRGNTSADGERAAIAAAGAIAGVRDVANRLQVTTTPDKSAATKVA